MDGPGKAYWNIPVGLVSDSCELNALAGLTIVGLMAWGGEWGSAWWRGCRDLEEPGGESDRGGETGCRGDCD